MENNIDKKLNSTKISKDGRLWIWSIIALSLYLSFAIPSRNEQENERKKIEIIEKKNCLEAKKNFSKEVMIFFNKNKNDLESSDTNKNEFFFEDWSYLYYIKEYQIDYWQKVPWIVLITQWYIFGIILYNWDWVIRDLHLNWIENPIKPNETDYPLILKTISQKISK